MNKILLIGGHGMMGRPVARRLVKEGFEVRALARNVDKARELLPEEVEVVQGDLKDVASIRKAAEGMQAVYLNLENPDPNASFLVSREGIKNIIEALKDRPDVLIAQIAFLELCHTNGWWPNEDLKYEAEEAIKKSGHPYLFFHPTWFMESLPLFVKDGKGMLIGRKNSTNPMYWIAGDDYGKMVGEAFKKKQRNRVFNVQGPEALNFDDALNRFAKAAGDDNVNVFHVPLFVVKLFVPFSPLAQEMHRLFYNATTKKEEFMSQTTWDELYKPQMKIEDYYKYMIKTGDVPKKG